MPNEMFQQNFLEIIYTKYDKKYLWQNLNEALILLMVVVYFIKHELLIFEECIRPEDLSSKKSLHLSYPSDGSGIQN